MLLFCVEFCWSHILASKTSLELFPISLVNKSHQYTVFCVLLMLLQNHHHHYHYNYYEGSQTSLFSNALKPLVTVVFSKCYLNGSK